MSLLVSAWFVHTSRSSVTGDGRRAVYEVISKPQLENERSLSQ